MTRERAKELLPIIQAYVEGKKIQVESHNHKWFDVTELDDDFESLNYRIKPEYNEIFKLKSMLEENHIPFEWVEYNCSTRYQICYPEKSKNIVCSVTERHGFLSSEEDDCDTILVNLTADDVFNRIRKHYEKTLRLPLSNTK